MSASNSYHIGPVGEDWAVSRWGSLDSVREVARSMCAQNPKWVVAVTDMRNVTRGYASCRDGVFLWRTSMTSRPYRLKSDGSLGSRI